MHEHRRALILLVAVLVLAAGGFGIASYLEESQRKEDLSTSSADFGQLPTITWNGETWRQKAGVHSILVIGYDKSATDERVGYRDGGQSDFLMVLVVNDQDRTVRQLHIDRDTMARVWTIGLSGKEGGSRIMQICLAHAYGRTIEENDARTVRSVENFLPGLKIENTVSMGLDIVPNFNHLLGGVTVTIEDDLTSIDPAMVKGATLKLTDEQAYWFTRVRMTVGDGKNTSRMARQRAFIQAASQLMLQRIQSDGSFAATLVNSVDDITHCTMSKGRLISEMNRAATYKLGEAETLPSEHEYGRGGYMECYVKEEDVMNWVLDALYDKIS